MTGCRSHALRGDAPALASRLTVSLIPRNRLSRVANGVSVEARLRTRLGRQGENVT